MEQFRSWQPEQNMEAPHITENQETENEGGTKGPSLVPFSSQLIPTF